jgi:hypothetical protein
MGLLSRGSTQPLDACYSSNPKRYTYHVWLQVNYTEHPTTDILSYRQPALEDKYRQSDNIGSLVPLALQLLDLLCDRV